MNHIKKKHGKQSREKLRGQIAIEEDDYSKVAQIVWSYDNIFYKGIDKSSANQLIQFEKESASIFYTCLMEIRISRKRPSLKTMYKRAISK